ncbi:MAG: sodium:solute symporter family protein [Bacteriovoracaceae bacterium]|nr:sodium:solute symporter family protein [Bacteriovoracaceae bacterium]
MEIRLTELIIVILYFAAMIGIGVWANRSTRTQSGFWVSSRDVGSWMVGLCFFSAGASGSLMISNPGFALKAGLAGIITMISAITVSYMLAVTLVASQLRKMGKYTVVDLLEERYGSKVLTGLSSIVVVAFLFYIAVQIKAGGMIGAFLFNISFGKAAAAMTVVFVLYVAIGGMKSVTLTEAIQAVLMLMVMAFLALTIMIKEGGFGELYSKTIENVPFYGGLNPDFPYLALVGLFITWFTMGIVSPHFVMRTLSAKNGTVARKGILIGAVLTGFFASLYILAVSLAEGAFFIGMADTDQAWVSVINRYFSPFLVGLTLAGVMAAVMSTTAAQLLACSASIVNDLYNKLINTQASEKALVGLGRFFVVVVAVVAFGVAMSETKIMTLIVTTATGFLASSFFFPIVLGIWWKRMNTLAAVWSGIIGFAVYGLVYAFKLFPTGETIIALPISGIVAIAVCLLTPPPPPEIVGMQASWHEGDSV